jgi:hypothetical protein
MITNPHGQQSALTLPAPTTKGNFHPTAYSTKTVILTEKQKEEDEKNKVFVIFLKSKTILFLGPIFKGKL